MNRSGVTLSAVGSAAVNTMNQTTPMIQTQVPAALRAAASILKDSHKAELLKLADLCEKKPTVRNARKAKDTAITMTYAYPAEGRTVGIYYAAYAANVAYIAAVYAAVNQPELAAFYTGFAFKGISEAMTHLKTNQALGTIPEGDVADWRQLPSPQT